MYKTERHNAPDAITKVVADNSCYELKYESTQNRIYLTVKGYWKNVEAVPEYINDFKKVLLLVRPDFTLLADLTTMITHPPALIELHVQAQKMVGEAGVLKVALVESKDRIAVLQNQTIVSRTNLPAQKFTNSNEAEEWLNKEGS